MQVLPGGKWMEREFSKLQRVEAWTYNFWISFITETESCLSQQVSQYTDISVWKIFWKRKRELLIAGRKMKKQDVRNSFQLALMET